MLFLTGKWVEFIVQVTNKEKGKLHIMAKDVETAETLIDFKQKKLDLWRGEEVARFSDFTISKGK